MLRHYLMPVVTRVAPDGMLERVPKGAGDGVYWSAFYSVEPSKQSFCMAAVEVEDHTPFLQDPEIDAFPDIDINSPLSKVVNVKQFAEMKKRIAQKGFNVALLARENTLIQALVICANDLLPGANSEDIKFKV